MLKKSASGVLASLRGSTRGFQKSETLKGLFRSPRSILGANGPTKCGPYLLASSLAAALLDGLLSILRLLKPLLRLSYFTGVLCVNRVFPQPAKSLRCRAAAVCDRAPASDSHPQSLRLRIPSRRSPARATPPCRHSHREPPRLRLRTRPTDHDCAQHLHCRRRHQPTTLSLKKTALSLW